MVLQAADECNLAVPPSNGYAQNADWEQQRTTITRLYINENRTLKEVKGFMEQQLGFRATERMYKTRLRQWGLGKYCKAQKMTAVSHSSLARKAEGTNTSVFVCKKSLDDARIESRRNRNKGWTYHQMPSTQNLNGLVSNNIASLTSSADVHARRSKGCRNVTALSTIESRLSQRSSPTVGGLLHIKKEEINYNHTPTGLNAVELAMLQTDYFYQDLQFIQGDCHDDSKRPRGVGMGHTLKSISPLRTYQLGSLEQLRDLELVLHQNNIYLHSLAETYSKGRSISSGKMRSVALDHLSKGFNRPDPTDFYNQYWLGMNFLQRGKWKAASLLIEKTLENIHSALKYEHPHLLSWASFTVCYRQESPQCAEVSETIVQFTIKLAKRHYRASHPFSKISSTLAISDFNVEACEALLKQTIHVFQYRLSVVNKSSVEILAKLYDLLSNAEDYDERVADAMKQWAKCSRDVARLVHEDERRKYKSTVSAPAT